MHIAPVVLGAAIAAHADVATFDDLSEGLTGTTLVSNGVTFTEGKWFVDDIDVEFAVEQADGDMPGLGFGDIYSAPNVMVLGGYVHGGNMGFWRVHSWKAHVDGETFTDAGVDVFYVDDVPGATLVLEGLVGDDVVSSDTFETAGDNPFVRQHRHLQITGPEFETLQFRIQGGDAADGLLAAFDNVLLEQGGCPADCNGDGVLNVLDFVCFQGEWQSQSPAGDCNADGIYNVLDFVCYQGVFQQGCP
jgi:hypothetical protein